MNADKLFAKFASGAARATGSPVAFILCVVMVVLWAASGPIFKFSETWQLVINTSTTIITFLMVFLIQNTQNRDSEAMHLKLDELIRSNQEAHNALLNLEELNEQDLDKIRDHYFKLAQSARHDLRSGKQDIGMPKVDVE